MSRGFSFNREFDFVRLDGLRRATGRPPHDWDIYIVKELIDNALDADDAMWRDESTRLPTIQINIEYIRVPECRTAQLFVQVSNNASFPIEQIPSIFATQWYTSRKAFIKGLTRGALGNALKTLLGIPYALRNRVAGDWAPELKPLSILSRGKEYLPRYAVDSLSQSIRFEYEERKGKNLAGTVISIGLDHFEQEIPRTMAEIQQVAAHYHLCNPHAYFSWKVEIEGYESIIEYPGDSNWRGKFRGRAPVQWYSPAAFQDLLGALYRSLQGDRKEYRLPLEDVCSRFFESLETSEYEDESSLPNSTIVKSFGRDWITATDIEGPSATQLYRLFCQHSASFDSINLGAIGAEHTRKALTAALPVEGDITYQLVLDAGDDPNVPFVIEASVSRLTDGKRQIWTAINYTPSYSDPFQTRWLRALITPDEPAFGLRGILDAYDLRENTPIVLFLHLICPNVEHHEFSKTEINHLPFKEALSTLLDRLLTDFRRAREEEELRLEQRIFLTLDGILDELADEERFVFEQLFEKLRSRLSQDSALAAWLQTPDAPSRLQTYINNYQSRSTILTRRVARPALGGLSIPLHPDRHFYIPTEHLSRELLAQHHVNKILYMQVPELEPIAIDNGWLCRMDLALLHNSSGDDSLREAMIQCVANSNAAMLILHNADDAGCKVVNNITAWLVEAQLETCRVVDLGLSPSKNAGDDGEVTKLVELMPGELAGWLRNRFRNLGIQLKSLPPNADIRRDIRERFERLLLGHIWEGISQQFDITRLLLDIDARLSLTSVMAGEALDDHVKAMLEHESCAESYDRVLDSAVGAYFKDFMMGQSTRIYELVQQHLSSLPK